MNIHVAGAVQAVKKEQVWVDRKMLISSSMIDLLTDHFCEARVEYCLHKVVVTRDFIVPPQIPPPFATKQPLSYLVGRSAGLPNQSASAIAPYRLRHILIHFIIEQ